MFEKYFNFKQNGTNLRTEIIAGITTFLTMAYILPSTLVFCLLPAWTRQLIHHYCACFYRRYLAHGFR